MNNIIVYIGHNDIYRNVSNITTFKYCSYGRFYNFTNIRDLWLGCALYRKSLGFDHSPTAQGVKLWQLSFTCVLLPPYAEQYNIMYHAKPAQKIDCAYLITWCSQLLLWTEKHRIRNLLRWLVRSDASGLCGKPPRSGWFQWNFPLWNYITSISLT